MTHHDARAEMKRPEQAEPEDSRPERHDRNGSHGHQMQGMTQMAEQVTRHYDEPAPHSERPHPEPFPPAVMRGLALGTALGTVVGVVFGYLLANSILVIPGWELMYSGAPATIYTLWTFLGAALGVATIGVGALLAAPAAAPQERPTDAERTDEPPAQRERAVGEP
jgi:hypothetical protein